MTVPIQFIQQLKALYCRDPDPCELWPGSGPMVGVRYEPVASLLLSLGADVPVVLQECMDRGWVQDVMVRDASGNRDRFVFVTRKILEAGGEIPGGEKPPLPERWREILKELKHKAMSGAKLAKKFDVAPSSFHTNFLNPMMEAGLIKNDLKIGGYYRPDAPPQ